MRVIKLLLGMLEKHMQDSAEWVAEAERRQARNKALYEQRVVEYAANWEANRPKSIKLKRVGKEVVEWKLGPGPCGRTVISLEASTDTNGITIVQKCDDHKAPDRFFYPHSVVEAMAVYTTYTPEVACQLSSPE